MAKIMVDNNELKEVSYHHPNHQSDDLVFTLYFNVHS